MTDRRLLIHTIFLLAAPVIVAGFGLSTYGALALVAILLLWRWLIVISGFVVPEKTPELVLETISASHFVEKVRWSMDRLGLEYTERPVAGTLGVFYRGRTVPQLKMRTGAVRSAIGNSSEILRYLWGRYGYENDRAAFLEPSDERVELEKQIDRYGVNLQLWIYYRILNDRELTLHAWGVDNPDIPLWQRQLLRLIFPLQAFLIRRSFSISDEKFARAVAHIEDFLADMNQRLTDNGASILSGEVRNYTDIAFAAITGIWLMPAGFGGGMADSVRVEKDRLPEPMRMDIDSWEAAYPRVARFVTEMYRDERRISD